MNQIYLFNDSIQFGCIQSTMVAGAGHGNIWNDAIQVGFILQPQMPQTGRGFFAIQVG